MKNFTIYTLVMLNAVFTLSADDFKSQPIISKMLITTAVVNQSEISVIGNDKEYIYEINPGKVKILKENNIINFKVNCREGSNLKIILSNPEPGLGGTAIKGVWSVNGKIAEEPYLTFFNCKTESFDIKFEIISIEAQPNAKIGKFEFHVGVTLNYLGY